MSSEPPRKPARHEAWAVAVLILATLLASRAWLTGVSGHRDRLFHSVAIRRLQDVILHGGDWRASPLGWPLDGGVAQADWVLGPAVLSLPLEMAGIEPGYQHSFLMILALGTTAWATHRVARALLGPGPQTWIAGIGGGLSTYAFSHGPHVNLVHHELAVAGALLLAHGLRDDRPRSAAAGAFLAALSAHFGVYMGAHGAAAVGLVLLLGLAVGWRSWRAHLAGWAGLLLGGATFAPAAMAYRAHAAKYQIEIGAQELAEQSVDLAMLLRPNATIPTHGALFGGFAVGGPDGPNPGYALTALAIVGLVAAARDQERRREWLVLGGATLATFLLALGPRIQFGGPTPIRGIYALFVDVVPIAESLRGPARFLGLTWVGVAVFAAAGARFLAQRTSRPALAWAGLLALLALELPVDNQQVAPLETLQPHPVYAEIDALRGVGALYDVNRSNQDDCNQERRIEAILGHHRSVVGGTWARASGATAQVNQMALSWPDRASDALFRRIRVRWVLVHPPFAESYPEHTRCEPVADHLLCELLDDETPLLSAVEAVSTEPYGPAIGVRWEHEPGAPPRPPAGDIGKPGQGVHPAGRPEHAPGSRPPPGPKRGEGPKGPGGKPISATCDGEELVSVPTPTWRVLSSLRSPGSFEVFFDRPCDAPQVAVPGGTLLYAVPGATETWPPEPLGPR